MTRAAARFFDALRKGDVEGLRKLLAADIQMIGDGGGKAPQWARGIIGAENVARVLASTFPWFVRIGVELEPHERERPSGRDLPPSGQQGAQYLDA